MASQKPDSYQCGAFEVARRPDVRQFVDKLNRLREAVDQCRLQPGVGYTVNRSSGGTTLTIQGPGGGRGAAPGDSFPWAVSVGRNEQTGWWFKVEPLSSLYTILNLEDAEVAGLGQEVPMETRELDEPFYACLTITYEDELEKDIFLQAFRRSRYPGIVVPNPSQGPQTASHTVLAAIDTSARVVQAVRGNLYNTLVNIAGYPALVPVTLLDYPTGPALPATPPA